MATVLTDDPFAFQVSRLTRRHRARHDPATVAQVTLQRWLAMRHRYQDPFDPELFDHIDARLTAMPASIDGVSAAPDTAPSTAARSGAASSGRPLALRPMPRSA